MIGYLFILTPTLIQQTLDLEEYNSNKERNMTCGVWDHYSCEDLKNAGKLASNTSIRPLTQLRCPQSLHRCLQVK